MKYKKNSNSKQINKEKQTKNNTWKIKEIKYFTKICMYVHVLID